MVPINPLQIPEVMKWLEQFNTVDRYVAIRLLRSLRYVSFQEFERYIQVGLIGLREDIHKESGKTSRIAIFPIRKEVIHQFNRHKEEKIARDSGGRIAHALINLERQYRRHFEIAPRKESLIASKTRNIVLVDDFIGSGNRLIDYWKNSVDPSIKSWVSRGLCKIWIVSYAAHEKGIKKICSNVGCLTTGSFFSCCKIGESNLLKNPVVKKLLIDYGKKTRKTSDSFGYGKLASPIVFQHGCPNNSPALLWSSGKTSPEGTITFKKGHWNALFPERGVPAALYPLFEADIQIDDLPELLWSSGQYKLALSFLEQIDYPRKGREKLKALTLLALISSGKSYQAIQDIMIKNDDEFTREIENLKHFMLINTHGHITRFGRDVLNRARTIPSQKKIENHYEVFYPSSFMGFQRGV